MDRRPPKDPGAHPEGPNPGLGAAGQHALPHAAAVPGAAASPARHPRDGRLLARLLAAPGGPRPGLAQLRLHPHGHVHGSTALAGRDNLLILDWHSRSQNTT